MFQLIITVMGIALVAMLAAASVNYLPVWPKAAGDVDHQLRTSLGTLEQVYDMATRARDGLAPPVLWATDGGLTSEFMAYLRFMPMKPAGYEWVYGAHAVDSSPWSGLNYFCLRPAEGTPLPTEGMQRGVKRARSGFSADQLFVSSSCGDTTNSAESSAFPLHVTFFVVYTPGLSR